MVVQHSVCHVWTSVNLILPTILSKHKVLYTKPLILQTEEGWPVMVGDMLYTF